MTRATVLVIDDDPIFRTMMGEILDDAGYQAILHDQARDAVDAVRRQQPNVVLLDLHLAQPAAGWTILDLLRLDRTTARIPIVVCSADATLLMRIQRPMQEVGCCILPKPFTIDHLLRVLAHAIRGEGCREAFPPARR